MEYPLEERIGPPELFTGRNSELNFFLKWIREIEGRKSKSTAIMARRKMGKSALLERLYNIVYSWNGPIVPFFFEVRERNIWCVDFSQLFLISFVMQYLAFKTRKIEYLRMQDNLSLEEAMEFTKQEGFDYLAALIKSMIAHVEQENLAATWNLAQGAPKMIAELRGEFVLQIVDEFQYMNRHIYVDKLLTRQYEGFIGSYLSIAESKRAPLLVSGSWVGWLMRDLRKYLPSRFKYHFLKNMPEDEILELIFKYSDYYEEPVTEETAYRLAELSEGNPFYASAVIRSSFPDKDLTLEEGLRAVLEYETADA